MSHKSDTYSEQVQVHTEMQSFPPMPWHTVMICPARVIRRVQGWAEWAFPDEIEAVKELVKITDWPDWVVIESGVMTVATMRMFHELARCRAQLPVQSMFTAAQLVVRWESTSP